MTSVSLENLAVVVTGGGRGIGRAYCLDLARRGARVVVNDVSATHADAVVKEVTSSGGTAVVSYDSVCAVGAGSAIVGLALDAFGTLDAVVNNAGIMSNGYFEDQTPAKFKAVADVHLAGSVAVTQAAWPVFRAKGSGRVVMTSSAGGLFAMQGEANYATAKAGVYGLAKALAYEGRPLGIMVNTVLPHAATTMTADDPVPGLAENLKPGVGQALVPRRLAEAVAPFVAFLVSNACTVTGEAFAVACGRFARVFVGETPGWVAPDALAVTPDDIATHLDDIRRQDGYSVPENLYEEIELFARAVGWQP